MSFALGTVSSGRILAQQQRRATQGYARRSATKIRAVIAPDEDVVPKSLVDYARTLPGISAPFPQLFDPANILSNAEGKRDPKGEVKRWRESEVTHGRVAMLATLGFIAQEQILGTNASRPFPHVEGPAINHFQQVEAQGAKFWVPLLFVIALAESYRVAVGWKNPASGGIQMLNDDYEPGDLGFDPLGLYPSDPKQQYKIKTKELNNGRLAMIAIAAFVVQELRVQKPIFAFFNLGGTTGTSIPPN